MYRIILLFSFLLSLGCQPDNQADAGEQRLSQIERQERRKPLDYLDLDGSYRKNFLGKTVAEGDIINKATLVTYKDVVLEVTFYSATDTRLGKAKHTIYEFFPPEKRRSFSVKVEAPKDTKMVEAEIIGAIPVVE